MIFSCSSTYWLRWCPSIKPSTRSSQKWLVWLPDCSVDPDFMELPAGYQDYLVYMCHSGTSILMLEWEVLNHGTVSPVSLLPLSLLLRQLSLYYTGEELGLPAMHTPPACASQVWGLQGCTFSSTSQFYYFVWKCYFTIKTLVYFPFLGLWQIYFCSAIYRMLKDTLINTMIHWNTNTSMRAEHSIFLWLCV